MSIWNPAQPISHRNRSLLGAGAVIAVLLLWSLLSGLELVAPNKLPAPWKVAHAFA